MSMPFLVFARLGETVVPGSLNNLLGDNYSVSVGVINTTLFLPPHICINIIYVYLFMYLRKRLRTTDTAHISSKHLQEDKTSNPSDDDNQVGNSLHHNDMTPVEDSKLVNSKPLSNVLSIEPGSSTGRTQTKCRYINVKELGTKLTSELQGNRDVESDVNIDKVGNVPEKALKARANGKERTKLRSTRPCNNRLGLERQRRLLITIGILLISLNVFMTPLDFTFIVEFLHSGYLTRKVKFIFITMAVLNSALNPVINILRIKPFQAILKEKARLVSQFLLFRR